MFSSPDSRKEALDYLITVSSPVSQKEALAYLIYFCFLEFT